MAAPSPAPRLRRSRFNTTGLHLHLPQVLQKYNNNKTRNQPPPQWKAVIPLSVQASSSFCHPPPSPPFISHFGAPQRRCCAARRWVSAPRRALSLLSAAADGSVLLLRRSVASLSVVLRREEGGPHTVKRSGIASVVFPSSLSFTDPTYDGYPVEHLFASIRERCCICENEKKNVYLYCEWPYFFSTIIPYPL